MQEIEKGDTSYIMKRLSDNDSVEMGEMKNMICIPPKLKSTSMSQATSFQISSVPFTRMYHIGIDSYQSDFDVELKTAGERVLNEPFIPRLHPENLTLQSLPFGFDTGID